MTIYSNGTEYWTVVYTDVDNGFVVIIDIVIDVNKEEILLIKLKNYTTSWGRNNGTKAIPETIITKIREYY